MDAPTIIAVITAATINGGAFIGFWVWARAKISYTSEQTAALSARLETWKSEVDGRCKDHHSNIDKIFDKLDEVKVCVAVKHTDTVRAITRLEEQVKNISTSKE